MGAVLERSEGVMEMMSSIFSLLLGSDAGSRRVEVEGGFQATEVKEKVHTRIAP